VDADVAVVGLGVMGGATLWRLAGRGVRVVGFEQHEPGHDQGSSHGESRIIRTAYFEGAHYVPLVRRAFELWRDLEAQSGADLLTITGALMIGQRDGELVTGTLASAHTHGLAHEVLDARAMGQRYPQHRLGPDEVGVYEDMAGVLRPEAAVRALVRRAEELGATVYQHSAVTHIEPIAGGVRVVAGDRAIEVGHAVVAVGPWLPTFLPTLAVPLRVERQVLAWFAPRQPELFAPGRFPVFIRELEGGAHRYGFPTLDGATVKVAVHHEGATTTARAVDRATHPADLAPLESFVTAYLPDLQSDPRRAQVCLYTNTPDGDFLIGSLPDRPHLTVLSPCSGHGFKFAATLGDAAADLALTGRTDYPVDAFSPRRFIGASASLA